MVKQKFRINIFDIFVVAVIIMAACIGVISYYNKPFLGDKNVLVEVKISDAEAINTALPKVMTAKEVYYSGTKYSVKQMTYRIEVDADGQIKYLYITLVGLGNITDGNSIFNGQRVYLNQKVEIRADYFVQGNIVDFRYEN